jgi:mannose-6-phosphate isomerase-like protein (cupin superfamily)
VNPWWWPTGNTPGFSRRSSAVDLVGVVLEGEGICAAGASETEVGPGNVVVVPAGRERGFQARTPMVLVVVVSPPPTEEDHGEVVRKLREGRWR